MPEESPLEQAAKTAPQTNQEKREEPKKVSTLESVVNESFKLVGNSVKIGLAALVPYAQATAFPALKTDTAVMAGAQVFGDATTSYKKWKKFTAGNVLESSIQGTIITPPLAGIYSIVNAIPATPLGYAAKVAYWGGFAYPVFLGMYQTVDYLIKNRTFRGLRSYIKENYWPTLKYIWKYLFPLSVLNALFAPAALQIPIGALLSYIFALFGAPKKEELKEEQKRDKTPYLVATPNVLGRLAYSTIDKLVYSPLKALYEIGSGYAKKSAEAVKPPTPAPAAPPPH